MALANIFNKPVSDEVVSRINTLTPETQPAWGKMSVAQMLAHCNVTYEMIYEDIHPKPNFLMKFFLKSFIKDTVISETPYSRNSRTAPAFLVSDARDFDKEKARLTEYISRTQALGEKHFNGKESHSFGPLNATEWNNMFYKHLNHHLTQFGV